MNGFRSFRFIGLLIAAVLLMPAMAQAQFSPSYNFLKAVKDKDGAKATEFLEKPGSTVINAKDINSGETALHIVVARRDITWLGFLLAKGANANLADNRGTTPLLQAVQLRFAEGVRTLLIGGAQVDKPNDNGETALIRAVQLRDLDMVRLLIAQGANADKRDSIAGMSARDYAQRDARTPGLLAALDTAKKPTDSKAVQGPTF